MNLFTKQRQAHRLWKQTYGYQREKVGGMNKLRFFDKHIPTSIYKIDNQSTI